MSAVAVLDDPRTITRLSFGPTEGTPAYVVGYGGVTAIKPYQEVDGHLWFGIHVQGTLTERVPAQMVIVHYQPQP